MIGYCIKDGEQRERERRESEAKADLERGRHILALRDILCSYLQNLPFRVRREFVDEVIESIQETLHR